MNWFVHVRTIENTPDRTQTISDAFTDPVFCSTPVGDTNIPDPIMLPTMTVTPFNKLILGFSCTPSSLAGATSASDPSSLRLATIFFSLFFNYYCYTIRLIDFVINKFQSKTTISNVTILQTTILCTLRGFKIKRFYAII